MILKRFHLNKLADIGNLITDLTGVKFPVWCYIGDDRPNRSTNQNKYLWGVVYKVISMELGYTVNEVHELCRFQFGIKKIYNFQRGKNKEVYIEDIPISTTEYDTKEMTDYIEAIRLFYHENGIHIPDANEIPDELLIEMKR